MAATLLLALTLFAPPVDEVDEAILRFKTEWAKARGNRMQDLQVKKNALTGLYVHRDERILKIYLDKFEKEKDDGVIEKCARGMAQYPNSKEACDLLFKRIKQVGKDKKKKGTVVVCFQTAANLDYEKIGVNEKYLDYTIEFLKSKEVELVIGAAKVLAKMKHWKGVKPMISLMDKLQDPVRKMMRSWEPPADLPEPATCDQD